MTEPAVHPVSECGPECSEYAPRAAAPKVPWHVVEVGTTNPDGTTETRRVEGDGPWVGASLRRLADQLDPPVPTRPTMRPGATGHTPGLAREGDMVRRQFGGVLAPPSDLPPRRDPMSAP